MESQIIGAKVADYMMKNKLGKNNIMLSYYYLYELIDQDPFSSNKFTTNNYKERFVKGEDVIIWDHWFSTVEHHTSEQEIRSFAAEHSLKLKEYKNSLGKLMFIIVH